MHSNYSDGGHSAVLCTLPLTGSLNNGYAVRYCSSKPLRASHIPKTLTEILHAALGIFKNMNEIILGR